MYAKIQRWGNSQAIRIPKAVLDTTSLKENDTLEITVEDNIITLKKIEKKYKSLDELFKDYTGNYKCAEHDTGKPYGKEVF